RSFLPSSNSSWCICFTHPYDDAVNHARIAGIKFLSFAQERKNQTKMTNEEILGVTVLNSWKIVINRFTKTISEFSDEQLQQQAAPGRNRVFYLVGHVIAINDRMFPLLGLGDRLHPELDRTYI